MARRCCGAVRDGNCSENIVFLAVFPRIDRLHVPIYPPQSPACSLCCLLVRCRRELLPRRRRRELFPRRRRQCLLFLRLSSALHGRSTPMSPRMNNNTSPPPSFSHHHAGRSALRRRRRTPVLTNRIADHSTTPYLRGSPLTIQIGCLPLSSAQAACFQITFEHHPPVCILLADPFKCVHVASCLADPIDCLRTLKKFLAGRSNKRFPAASLFQRGSACV